MFYVTIQTISKNTCECLVCCVSLVYEYVTCDELKRAEYVLILYLHVLLLREVSIAVDMCVIEIGAI